MRWRGTEQERRVEIALDGVGRAELFPGDVDGEAPVDADDVAAGRGQVRENRGRPGAEMNGRDVGRFQGREDLGGMRAGELAVVLGRERPDPRVEDLDGLGARFDLRHDEGADHLGQAVAQPVPRLGVAVHQRLGPGEVARGPALDGVRRQRERRAGEADERDAAVELPSRHRNRVQHVAEPFARLEQPEPFDVSFGPERLLDPRAFAFDEVERQAHRFEGQQQVREDDGGVDVDGVDRLQGDAGGQLGRPTELEEGVPFA